MEIIAEYIFESIQKELYIQPSIGELVYTNAQSEDINIDRREIELFCKQLKVKKFSNSSNKKCGCIVMNYNPFTKGHLYLVENSLKLVNYLYVFVVEEDKSYFSFEERYMIAKSCLAKFKNIKVIPSGQFIISIKTFPEYFEKDAIKEISINPSYDLRLFCKYIAPILNLSIRFAGSEPTDHITNQYNSFMKEILSTYGIKFVEIPRLEEGRVISATTTRELFRMKDWKKLEKIVPRETLEYLKVLPTR